MHGSSLRAALQTLRLVTMKTLRHIKYIEGVVWQFDISIVKHAYDKNYEK